MVRGPDGPAGYFPEFGGYGIGALANAPNPDLSAAYAVHAGLKEHLKVLAVEGNFSSRASLRDRQTLIDTNPFLTEEEVDKALLAVVNSEKFVYEYSHKNFGPIFAQAKPIFDGKIWVEGADVKKGLDEVCAAVGPILAE
jgi:hypothetical protein